MYIMGRLDAKHRAPNRLLFVAQTRCQCLFLPYMGIRSSLKLIYSVIYCRYCMKYSIMEEDEMVKQRILLISLVGFLIFGLLLGGKVIYQKNWQDVSILRQSQQISGVVSAKIVDNNGLNELDVVTNKVTNLHQASLALQKLANNLPIRFLDRDNDALKKLSEQMQFAVQEGIARGNFTVMAQNVRTQAEKAGVQLDLEIDNDAIYMSLNQGNAQLLEVIERHGQVKYLPTEKQ